MSLSCDINTDKNQSDCTNCLKCLRMIVKVSGVARDGSSYAEYIDWTLHGSESDWCDVSLTTFRLYTKFVLRQSGSLVCDSFMEDFFFSPFK